MGITVTQATSATGDIADNYLLITGVNAAVGDMLLVTVVADNAGSLGAASLTEVQDGYNTYTQRSLMNNDPGAANAGVTTGIWTSVITSALVNATIEATFSTNTTVRIGAVFKLSPGSGETIGLQEAGTEVITGENTVSTTTGTLQSGDVVVGILGAERKGLAIEVDADTTNGTWSSGWTVEAGVTGTSGQLFFSQYKTVTAGGTQTWNLTLGTSTDICYRYLVFRATSPAGSNPRFQHQYRQRFL